MNKTAQPPARTWRALVLAAAALLAWQTHGGTVYAPYANDFSLSAADVQVAPADRWTHLPALGVLSNNFRNAVLCPASVNVANLGGAPATARPFTLRAAFTLRSGRGTYSYVGVGALCGTDALPDTQGYLLRHYIDRKTSPLPLSLRRNGTVVAEGTSFVDLRYSYGVALEYVLSGRYVDTNADGRPDALDLVGTLRNPATGGSSSVSYRDTAPLAGTHFGMKAYDANNVPSLVEWSALSVSNDRPRGTVMLVQ